MPRNRLPRVMKHYSTTGRRNHGRPLKRLLGTWDRNGSTSGPTAWYIDDDAGDDDDDILFCAGTRLHLCIVHFETKFYNFSIAWDKKVELSIKREKPRCKNSIQFNFWSFRFLWPCIVSKVWREKNQQDATMRLIIIIIINFYLNMFRASLCPSSGEQRPCYCIWCIVL